LHGVPTKTVLAGHPSYIRAHFLIGAASLELINRQGNPKIPFIFQERTVAISLWPINGEKRQRKERYSVERGVL
jgi:hypothetical protein